MLKYHINDKGETGVCKSTQGRCPFGGDSQHYDSPEKATQAFELSMAATLLKSVKKNAKEPTSIQASFLNVFSLYVLDDGMTEVEKEQILEALKYAQERLSGDNIFEKASNLRKDFLSRFDSKKAKELERLPRFAFLHTLIPTFGKAMVAFEEPFIFDGTSARDEGWLIGDRTQTKAALYFDLEDTFFKAVGKEGTLDNAENLAKSFREEAIKDGWENLYENDAVILAASEKALEVINEDRINFNEDFVLFGADLSS